MSLLLLVYIYLPRDRTACEPVRLPGVATAVVTGAATDVRTFLAKEGSANRASTGNVCVSNHCNKGTSIPVPLNAY